MKKILSAIILTLALVGQANAQTALFPERGGTGATTTPSRGQVLVGQVDGTYQPQATSTLGFVDLSTLSSYVLTSAFGALFDARFAATTTTGLAEGANLYWTNLRFDNRLAATTTLNNITTLGGLSLPLTQTTGTLPISKGGTGQTSFGQGWLSSNGTTLSASTSPTVNYLTATSTTATSTFPLLSVTNGFSIFGNFINSLASLKSLTNYFTLSGSNLVYTGGNVGIGTSTPGTPLSVQGRAVIADNVVTSTITATSTTATSTLPNVSSSFISSLWGTFTRLIISSFSGSKGMYVAIGDNGELVATSSPQAATLINISGVANSTNVTFTASSEPLLLYVNGIAYPKTGGLLTWTYNAGVITLSNPIGFNDGTTERLGTIFGMSLGTNMIATVNDPYVVNVPAISGDATAVLQTYINTMSALGTSTGRISTIRVPTTEYSTDQLNMQPNVTLECNNTKFSKRNDAVGQVNASVLATTRYAVGGEYYGQYDNITIKGGCHFYSNNKTLGQAIVKLWDVRNLWIDGAIFQHSPLGIQHALNVCGRGIRVTNSIVTGGTETVQDGFHVNCGDDIQFTNIKCDTSGDDCVAFGRDIAGPSNLGADEGISNVTVTNLVCNSVKGRCANPYAGHDFIDSGYANVRKVENVTVTNASGNCAQIRSSCLGVLEEQDYGQIFKYTITSGGTGYTSGTYFNQATTGGGCTTQPTADVTIAGGVITRVIPANLGVSGFGVGAGCTSSPTLSLTGLGAGTGANVTGNMSIVNTNLVNHYKFQGTLTQGTTTGTHDGVQSGGALFHTGNYIDIDVHMTFLNPATTTRPWTIYCGDNYNIKWTQTGTTPSGGWIYPSLWGCSPKNWKWHDSTFQSFDGITNPGEAVFYNRGGNTDNWSITDSTFADMSSSSVAIAFNPTGATSSNLKIIGNTMYKATGATGTRFLHGQGCINCIDNLVMIGNDLSRVDIPLNGATGFQDAVTSYRIRDNLGIKTGPTCGVQTILAGATSTSPFSTRTLTGYTTSGVLGAGHLRVQLLAPIYATTSPSVSIVSTSTAVTGVQSPVSSNQSVMVCEDTSTKPIN